MKLTMRIIALLLYLLSISIVTHAQMANTIKKTFNRTTIIQGKIDASPEVIWKLLTNAPEIPNWNSTITALTGEIKLGEKIQLNSSLDPNRTFKLKVKEYVLNSKLVWGDAMGKRTFTLTKNSDGQTNFSMVEKIGGFVFPLFANKIPSFDESFDKFFSDLKKAAEK